MTWLDKLTFDTVVIHTDIGPSLKGLRAAVHDDCVVLRDVLVMHESDAPQQLGGLYVVPRERVVGMQILDPSRS
jgi:hypothetical protein